MAVVALIHTDPLPPYLRFGTTGPDNGLLAPTVHNSYRLHPLSIPSHPQFVNSLECFFKLIRVQVDRLQNIAAHFFRGVVIFPYVSSSSLKSKPAESPASEVV